MRTAGRAQHRATLRRPAVSFRMSGFRELEGVAVQSAQSHRALSLTKSFRLCALRGSVLFVRPRLLPLLYRTAEPKRSLSLRVPSTPDAPCDQSWTPDSVIGPDRLEYTMWTAPQS